MSVHHWVGVAVVALGGTAWADATFSVVIEAPSVKVGAAAEAHVKLTPGPGFHVNQDYPTALKLSAPSGVELPTPTLDRKGGAKIDEKQAVFDVRFTAREAGKKTFTGILSFAVCSPKACDPHKEKVSFTVDVSQ